MEILPVMVSQLKLHNNTISFCNSVFYWIFSMLIAWLSHDKIAVIWVYTIIGPMWPVILVRGAWSTRPGSQTYPRYLARPIPSTRRDKTNVVHTSLKRSLFCFKLFDASHQWRKRIMMTGLYKIHRLNFWEFLDWMYTNVHFALFDYIANYINSSCMIELFVGS